MEELAFESPRLQEGLDSGRFLREVGMEITGRPRHGRQTWKPWWREAWPLEKGQVLSDSARIPAGHLCCCDHQLCWTQLCGPSGQASLLWST